MNASAWLAPVVVGYRTGSYVVQGSRVPTAHQPEMPSDVTQDVSWFDRFAGGASLVASRATFFAFCVLLVVLWLPSWFLIQDLDLWQLIINTVTTIVTFLMVALLQNSQRSAEECPGDRPHH
jgi:hypothetical protein